jgi:hypothetical protein
MVNGDGRTETHLNIVFADVFLNDRVSQTG